MNTSQSRKTRRMTRMALVGLAALTLFAASAAAIPLGLSHQVDTPAGSVAANASEKGADTCIGASVPPLPATPAVPAIPLPVPVALPAVPAVPSPQGYANLCAAAGPDGVSTSVDADAMGAHAGTGADVDTSAQHDAVKQTAGGAKGFLEGLASRIASWF